MTDNECCRYLDWDSNFFRKRIAILNSNRLNESGAKEALEWCREKKIDCLYFLADSNDATNVRVAEAHQFHFVDVRITLERKFEEAELLPPQSGVRLFQEQDLNQLKGIAAESHRDSRFYFDHNFERRDCDRLYETWIENSCRRSADAVFVAEHERIPAGYITCHLSDSNIGSIGLVAVAGDARGKRMGESLVNHALRWFIEHGAETVTVVTQARNLAAQRLYQRCRFQTYRVQNWYHRWFSPSESFTS